MARQVIRFEAETTPPSVHPTQRDAVIAEMAAIMGSRSDELSGPPLIARLIVDRAPQVIACLQQLVIERENARVD